MNPSFGRVKFDEQRSSDHFLGSLERAFRGILHNIMRDLQGGKTDEYYHLTAAEYAALGPDNAQNILANRVFGG